MQCRICLGWPTSKTDLLRSRRAVDLSFATPASARAAGFQTAVNFTDVLEAATRLEESVTSQLVQGQGSVPHSVVFVAAQLREVSDVMVAAAREGDLLYQIFVAPELQLLRAGSSAGHDPRGLRDGCG